MRLGLVAGFGWDTYGFAAQTPVVLPTAEYPYLRPGLRGRFVLEGELLVLEVNAAYRAILDRGELSMHFGDGGDSQGFDTSFRLGGSLDIGLSYGAEIGLAGTFLFFSGDATTALASQAVDISLWAGATVGFAIR